MTPTGGPPAQQPDPLPLRDIRRDQLVDLHVLAENGDPNAAATARRWLAEDPEARRAWDEVQRTCDQIHGRDPVDDAPATGSHIFGYPPGR